MPQLCFASKWNQTKLFSSKDSEDTLTIQDIQTKHNTQVRLNKNMINMFKEIHLNMMKKLLELMLSNLERIVMSSSIKLKLTDNLSNLSLDLVLSKLKEELLQELGDVESIMEILL